MIRLRRRTAGPGAAAASRNDGEPVVAVPVAHRARARHGAARTSASTSPAAAPAGSTTRSSCTAACSPTPTCSSPADPARASRPRSRRSCTARSASTAAKRFIAINDPKGEYHALGERLGMPVIKLHPGGVHRLNPLDPAPGDRDDRGLLGRQRLVVGMLSVVLERRLEPAEESLVAQSIAHLADARQRFDLADLARVVGDPPGELLAHVRVRDGSPRSSCARPRRRSGSRSASCSTGPCAACSTDRPPSSVDWDQGPGVVIDLSAVFQDREALPLVMMAATSWLQSAMTALAPGRRGLQVDDEVWALLANEWTVRHLQARLKLCRHWGICNILVCHRLSDLRAQAADGTAAHKLAAGLLGDTGTRIFFQQAPDQVADATELLGLTDEEARHLPRLVRGRALWRVGEHAAIVHHVLSPARGAFCDTDQAMAA